MYVWWVLEDLIISIKGDLWTTHATLLTRSELRHVFFRRQKRNSERKESRREGADWKYECKKGAEEKHYKLVIRDLVVAIISLVIGELGEESGDRPSIAATCDLGSARSHRDTVAQVYTSKWI